MFQNYHYCFIMVSIHFATILTNRQWSTESPVEYIWRAKKARFYQKGTQESYFAFVAPHSLLNSSRFNGEKEKGGCTCAATTFKVRTFWETHKIRKNLPHNLTNPHCKFSDLSFIFHFLRLAMFPKSSWSCQMMEV